MQIFHRSTNTVAKVSIFGGIFFLGAFAWIYSTLLRSSYVTGQNVIVDQPVPFSHQHHAAELGLDCRYCHTSVEKSSFAGLPPTATCMNCHRQIWTNAQLLAPVRDSYATGTPLRWARVHDLPDYAYFNHKIHIAKGVGCATCHGQVDKMPLMFQNASLQMEWCLDCHRNPARYVRPREEVFNMEWQPPADPEAARRQGIRLVKEYKILPPANLTSCSTCHR
ncbi:MAG TPA: cytochrome c3 family protein [Thermoanaerobaculia bacterium]|nr:cytochrome c3 family protein [Thermoanaerobaculia bacterium]